MACSKKPLPFVLAAAAAALLPSAAHALGLVDVENLDSYAGIATITVTKAPPGKPNKVEEIANYSMVWNGANHPYAYAPGLSQFIVDFRSLLGGSGAPTGWGEMMFSLDLEQGGFGLSDLNLGSPQIGSLDDVLPLAQAATDFAVWEATAKQGAHSATYRLFLFDAAPAATPETTVSVAAVPEPGLLALLGIGLGGLAVTRRRKAA